jgi:type IV pilus assembly protein PilF
MNKVKLLTITRGLLALGLLVLISACVTETESVFTDDASPEKALEKRVALARQYIGEGNWVDAKRNLAIAANIDDQNPEVYEAFALVYQSTGESELAEESFKKAISLGKDFSRARNNYAAFLFSQQRFEEAETQLEYVIQDTLYTGRPQAFINLGLCRLQTFDPQGAEEAFVRALSMDRNNLIALLELSQLRFEAKDYETAEQYYATYRKRAVRQSSRSLWLGVRIARATGDQDAESSHALALRNLYPDSEEYQAYRRTTVGG